MNNLAIIPARGGSKRIPQKNIKPFLGKPIIAYSIEVALKSGLFSDVIVSTDDEKIAEISAEYGASIPFMRSQKNSDDFATLNDVFKEIKAFYEQRNSAFDTYCMILPTAPLITINFLREAFNHLIDSDLKSIRPVVEFNYPVQRAFRMIDNRVSFINPQYAHTRSQDLEKAFHDAGMFYFIKNDCQMTDEPKGGFKIPPLYAQDIDDESDWKLAEFKYDYLFGR
jgi:N-acylneuraminate cytidylyltransferase